MNISSTRRVRVIALIAILVTAGCSGVAGGLQIAADDATVTTFGNVEVTVTVENTADDSAEGTLTCEVEVGGRLYDKSLRVLVGGGDRQTYEMKFDIPASDFGQSGSYQCELD